LTEKTEELKVSVSLQKQSSESSNLQNEDYNK